MIAKVLFLIFNLFYFFSGFIFSQVVVNDELFENQWYLNMPGPENTRADIRALDAWARTMGNSSQKIADIEDDIGGVPSTFHPDLLNRINTNGNIVTGEHSTNIAGLLVANHNTIGIAGLNKFATLNSYVYTDVAEWADRVYNARVDGNDIINISQGLYQSLAGVGVQLAKAYNSNIVNVVSVGNDNRNVSHPAVYSSVIAVGASTKDNTKAGYSNYGHQIEFLAPGGTDTNPLNEKNIFTTSSNDSYVYVNGTSFAAPLVSGAASLLLSYKPGLENDDVKNILINSCDKLPEMQGQNFTEDCGYGRINLKRAMTLLESPYELDNLHSSIGGSVYSESGYENYWIYGITGLANGRYIVKRFEVRKEVYFTKSYYDHLAWGRGSSSIGWDWESPNFGKNYCDIVEGTLNSNSVTLKTYVYKVWTTQGQYKGWYPCEPQNVKFSYSVLGVPLVSPIISSLTQSPDPICQGSYGYVYCNLSQGNGNLTYNWSAADLPSGAYITPLGNRCKVTYPNTAKSNAEIQIK